MWGEADYTLDLGCDPTPGDIAAAADFFGPRVLRSTFAAPGFALARFAASTGSLALRRAMLAIRERLSEAHHRLDGRGLAFLSLGRFDQQVTTRFHLDGAPSTSVLMLGYEPTAVASRVWLADYARCAFDLGLSPTAYLDRHNPMFPAGEMALEEYITEVTSFDSSVAQILLINNSRSPFDPGGASLQGVLHKAEIASPDLTACRVINSAMMVPDDEPGAFSGGRVAEFLAAKPLARPDVPGPMQP